MKIDKNIPLPGTRCKYPWAELRVGDSFHAEVSAPALRATARYHAEKTGRKFLVRQEGSGARAWRSE